MGSSADLILDGYLDASGTYVGKSSGIKSFGTNGGLSSQKIRKELAILINKEVKNNPEVPKNRIVNDCRCFINKKYGHDWRNY